MRKGMERGRGRRDAPARTIFFLPSLSRCTFRSVSVKELDCVLCMTFACVSVDPYIFPK